MGTDLLLSPIKEIELRASRIPGVVSLAQGVPSFDTPESVKRFAIEAIVKGKVAKYSLAPGIIELREVIAAYLEKENKFYDFEKEIIVTSGSIEAITATLLAFLNPGDEVIIPDPTYTSYQAAIRTAKGVPVFAPLVESRRWGFDISFFESKITSKTKAILFCNPNNPTGTIFTKSQLLELAKLALEHKLIILSDEVYKDFVYDSNERIFSLAEERNLRENLVYIFSFSKAYAMTGWRVAFLAADKKLANKILAVHDALVTCAPVVSQYAALAALEMARKDLLEYKRIFKKRRDLICQRLENLSEIFDYQKPGGAYFVFPRYNKEKCQRKYAVKNSREFAFTLLEKARVATVPGSAFGPSGEEHLRMCFGKSSREINEAFDRLDKFFLG